MLLQWLLPFHKIPRLHGLRFNGIQHFLESLNAEKMFLFAITEYGKKFT